MGAFKIMLLFFFIALVFLIGIFLMNSVLNFLPAPTGYTTSIYAPLVSLKDFFASFFDNSFLFMYIIVIVIDLAVSWFKPNKFTGIGNIILLFALAFVSLFIQIGVITLQAIFSFNTLLPITYSFFANGYYLLITFFALIISIIFNFRNR